MNPDSPARSERFGGVPVVGWMICGLGQGAAAGLPSAPGPRPEARSRIRKGGALLIRVSAPGAAVVVAVSPAGAVLLLETVRRRDPAEIS